MPIYALTENELVPVAATSFSAENIHERRHIQQLLKANISVLDPGLMVIAEEFGDWIDSSRRIDLLCIDTDANLVVVELKRTEDGGHMELQALRYAAMISAMTFEQLVETYARYLNPGQPDHDDALTGILQFLGWDTPGTCFCSLAIASTYLCRPKSSSSGWRGMCGTHWSSHMRGCPRELIFQPFAKEGLLLVDSQVTSLNFRRH